jgi:hypothetical protein
MLLQGLFFPFKILAIAIKLLVRLILLPLKLIVAGMLLQIGMSLVFIAIVVVLGYYIYQWVT